MKKIIFICPYFGNLPEEQMTLWLQSCEKNSTIDWIIFTDDNNKKLDYPANVRVIYTTLKKIAESIQKLFDFKIKLNSPYKLCDFKPVYGYIFYDYIKEYDFWGHCDMSDCIFGNIRNFINDEMLELNDKIGFLGHLTLYRNNEEVNKRFMLKTKSKIELKEILGNKENKAFDELNEYSINTIYNEYGFSLKRIDEMYVDISPMRFSFQAACYDDYYRHFYKKFEPMIFEWNNGNLYECTIKNSKIKRREIMYVHFQKRKMIKQFNNKTKKYYIIPNKFVSNLKLENANDLKKITKNRIYFVAFKLKYKSFIYRIKKILYNR